MKYKFTINKNQALLQFTGTPKEAKKLYNWFNLQSNNFKYCTIQQVFNAECQLQIVANTKRDLNKVLYKIPRETVPKLIEV